MALDVYKVTKLFPKDELFGLTSQIRRAISSIPTNIAEGCGRETNKDFAHFLQISIGSASETEYLLFLARDLKYINSEVYDLIVNEIVSVRKMIIKYKSELKA